MYSSSYLYSNSNQEAYEQFQKPSAILRSILFVLETTKTQQQKTKRCFYSSGALGHFILRCLKLDMYFLSKKLNSKLQINSPNHNEKSACREKVTTELLTEYSQSTVPLPVSSIGRTNRKYLIGIYIVFYCYCWLL